MRAPHQNNGTDCGVYLLMFAETFLVWVQGNKSAVEGGESDALITQERLDSLQEAVDHATGPDRTSQYRAGLLEAALKLCR